MKRLLAGVFCMLALATGARAGLPERQRLPGAPLSMEFPEDFAVDAEGMRLSSGTGAGLVAQRLLGSLADNLETHFGPEALKEKGMRKLGEETIILGGGEDALTGRIMELAAPGALHWALLAEKDRQTVLVLSTTPEALTGEHQAIRMALDSLVWEKEGWFDPFFGLSYRFKEPEGLKFVRRDGPVLIYTEAGVFPAKGKTVFLIAKEGVAPGRLLKTQLEDRAARLGLFINPKLVEEGASAEQSGPERVWGVWKDDLPMSPALAMAMIRTETETLVLSSHCPAEDARCGERLISVLGTYRRQ